MTPAADGNGMAAAEDIAAPPGAAFAWQGPAMRRGLMWIPLALLLVPLAWGQGWIGEVVLTLLPYNEPPTGLAYFFVPHIEPTRVLNGLPLALALLTPWPTVVIAALVVVLWLLAARVTYGVAATLAPGERTAALLAFFVAGTTAYDTALLQASYLPLFLAAVLHWCGFLALLRYCTGRAPGWLVASAALQCASLATYATALAAIALGPLLAFALVAPRDGRRAASRVFVAVALAWWLPLAAYLAALAWVAAMPGNYMALGGLRVDAPATLAARLPALVATNFVPTAWLRPFPLFGDPVRIIGPAIVVALAAGATVIMLALLASSLRGAPRAPRPAGNPWAIGMLMAIVVASNAATSVLLGADHLLRTHLVSRLYASVLIAFACVALLRARRPVVRAGGALLVVAFLAIGSWTVADRGAYLVSIWPRLRTELVSLDEAVRRIDPAAAIVLYQPRAAGYSATVATWHGIAWLMLIRGPGMPNPAFALWSPDRDANCVADAADLRCTGDMQPPSRFPIERLVVLRYDPVDCRIKLVEGAAAGARLPALPAAYDPGKWIREPPAPVSPLVGKVLHGPQGLGRDVGCNPAAAF